MTTTPQTPRWKKAAGTLADALFARRPARLSRRATILFPIGMLMGAAEPGNAPETLNYTPVLLTESLPAATTEMLVPTEEPISHAAFKRYTAFREKLANTYDGDSTYLQIVQDVAPTIDGTASTIAMNLIEGGNVRNAKSPEGVVGTMQTDCFRTKQYLGDLYDESKTCNENREVPRNSYIAGHGFLQDLLDKYNWHPEGPKLAAAAYNGGTDVIRIARKKAKEKVQHPTFDQIMAEVDSATFVEADPNGYGARSAEWLSAKKDEMERHGINFDKLYQAGLHAEKGWGISQSSYTPLDLQMRDELETFVTYRSAQGARDSGATNSDAGTSKASAGRSGASGR